MHASIMLCGLASSKGLLQSLAEALRFGFLPTVLMDTIAARCLRVEMFGRLCRVEELMPLPFAPRFPPPPDLAGEAAAAS